MNQTLCQIFSIILSISSKTWNSVNNDYQHDSRAFYALVPSKLFVDKILNLNFIFLQTFNSEFSDIEVWFTDQNSKLPETEDKIYITFVNN